jgi:hypothetical protein
MKSAIYLCAMREPANPHFILSDGEYCHFLEDRLFFGKIDLPKQFPSVNHRPDILAVTMQFVGIFLLLSFLISSFMVKFYVLVFILTALLATLSVWTMRTIQFSTAKWILRKDIVGATYHKQQLGYDYFIIQYSPEKGKLFKRRVVIYDSERSLEQALRVMTEEGILKK